MIIHGDLRDCLFIFKILIPKVDWLNGFVSIRAFRILFYETDFVYTNFIKWISLIIILSLFIWGQVIGGPFFEICETLDYE